jgi:hypothetical protein
MPASPALGRPSCWLAGRKKEKTVCVVSEGWGRERVGGWVYVYSYALCGLVESLGSLGGEGA